MVEQVATEQPMDIFNRIFAEMEVGDDKYIDSLIKEAKGDFEFILRKLDNDHKIALGTDDVARANFLEKVADELEKRIGTIPYDYERYTKRELQDLATGTERITSDRDLALARLDEDEQILKRELQKTQLEDTQLTKEDLNARGMFSSGVADKELADLSGEYDEKRAAIERALGRERFDTNTAATRGLYDLTTNSTRRQEDMTVEARRAAQGAEDIYSFGKEGAKRDYDARKKAYERERAKLDASRRGSALTQASYEKYGFTG